MSGPDHAAEIQAPAAATSRRSGLRTLAPVGLCVIVAIGIWLVFYPALMSPDSMDQYDQARTGKFHDWHPPIMAIVLSGVFALGGHIAVLMLAQCIAGLLGVRALAFELLSLAAAERGSAATRHWLATGIALFLLLPLSPLALYLMTFWKDTWFAILLLWCGALATRLYRSSVAVRARGDTARLAVLVLLMGVAPLVRYNALATLPVLCTLAGVVAVRRFGWRAGLAGLVPLAVFAATEYGMGRTFEILRLRPMNQIKVLDLVGVCVLEPSARAALPFTSAHLADDFDPSRYQFGNIVPLIWDAKPLVKRGYLQGGANDELGQEYRYALRTYPGLIAEAKLRAFQQVMGLLAADYWFQPQITPNDLGLAQPAWNEPIRRRWVALGEHIADHHRWRWVGAVPAVWLGVNIVLLIAVLMTRRPYRGLHVLLLLVPLSYFASYLVATPSHDFRLTYPSTLFVQVVLTAAAVAAIAHGLARPSRR